MKVFIRRWFWPCLACLSLGGLLWLWRENVHLSAQLAQWRSEEVTKRFAAFQQNQPTPFQAPQNSSTTPSSDGTSPLATSKTQQSSSQTVLDTVKREVVVSLGTVEDIGARFANFLAAEEARRLRRRSSGLGATDMALTTDEEAAAKLQSADIAATLPEVERFQDRPAEYGRFFKSLFQTGGGLTDEEAAQVEKLMTARAEEGIRQGLNASRKPTEGYWAWELKRDSFNEETADQLEALLPDKAKERFPVNGTLMEWLEGDVSFEK